MQKIIPIPLAFVILALNAGAALAHKHASPVYVAPGTFDARDMLPKPPSADSAAEKSDLMKLHAIEQTRSAEDIAHARADSRERDIFIFRTVLGDEFNAATLPLTARLSANIEDDVLADAEPVKDDLPRARPYNIDKTLHPVCKHRNRDDAYPSGHTITGYVMALTLASMLPEKRSAIFARADDYARNRLICGVHHPSDVEAGKELAYALYGRLEASPKFRADRAAAEAELRKALHLSAQPGAPE
ncbi:MAG: phosphatase PAP2 family protein [Beijerinckiaceae bacterium]|nr:MAG: phosphatase PAP2 family protein [Beijerinckiaceae bacterium]